MRLSRYPLFTLRNDPKEVESISHRWLLRGGYIRGIAAGIYNLLPTGVRAIRKMEGIVREEMNRIGGLEVQLPLVQPAELWIESGRYEIYGKELLRFTDRNDRPMVLGPTHEEVITDLVRGEVQSYRELPLLLYQIHTKFRDEPRPRFGMIRAREFSMKDAYSFHATWEDLQEGYEKVKTAYQRIFDRCELKYTVVEADTGAIGGTKSHEFVVHAKHGEARIVTCSFCSYSANIEMAEFFIPEPTHLPTETPLQEVPTPDCPTIESVSEYLKVPQEETIKAILLETSRGPVLALIRGDRPWNESKLLRLLQITWWQWMEEDRAKSLGLVPGYAGPFHISPEVLVVADRTVFTVRDGVSGANRYGFHFHHVVPGRDFHPHIVGDFAEVKDNDLCPRCEKGVLTIENGIEVGHIFQLGTRYSEKMQATFLDRDGKRKPFVMGCYGIGIGRTLSAAIEQLADEKGIVLPPSLAPFSVSVIPLDSTDPNLLKEGERIYLELSRKGVDVLLDDREERAGVKLTDWEIIGIPYRIVLGKRGFQRGVAEVGVRQGGTVRELPLSTVVEEVHSLLSGLYEKKDLSRTSGR